MLAYLCADLEDDYSITSTQLSTWNTWLASNCNTNLYAGMAADDVRPVCIGVNASAPVGTATMPPSKTSSTATKASSSASRGPTARGEVTGCLQYHTVQSGDTCTNVETIYSISFTELYQWNPSSAFSIPRCSTLIATHIANTKPAVGSSCQSLWLGYAYCVRGPVSSTSTTTSGTSPPAPTQSGIVSNCDE